MLGADHAGGVPSHLFARGKARWLAVQPHGHAEPERTLLVSVPYALARAPGKPTLGWGSFLDPHFHAQRACWEPAVGPPAQTPPGRPLRLDRDCTRLSRPITVGLSRNALDWRGNWREYVGR